MKRPTCVRTAVLTALYIGTAMNAQGQTAPADSSDESRGSDVLEEIVVTAQKRAENLQDTPLSVTAVSGEDMLARQVLTMQSLAQSVPNFDFGLYSGNAHIAIRGMGFDSINPGAEARVAYHTDGVYVSRPAVVLGTFFDINRVEVLRGPQGTLYGRNSTGGSVNVITNDPTDSLEGYYRQTIGNYSQFIEEGAIGGPIGETVSGRLAFQVNNRDGYGENRVTGNDIDNVKSWSARGKLKLQMSDDFDILLSGDYHEEDDQNYGFHYMGPGNPNVVPPGVTLGVPIAESSRDIAQTFDPINDRTIWGAGLVATWNIGDALTIRSITGYRDSKYRAFSDATGMGGTLLPFNQIEESQSFSEEVQLAKETDKYNWIVGLYYFDEDIKSFSEAPVNAALFGGDSDFLFQGYWAGGKLSTKAYAAFGQLTYNFTDAWSATLGLRYGDEEKTINDGIQFDLAREYSPSNDLALLATQKDSISNDSFTPKIGLEYRVSPEVMTYVSVSDGYKSGSFDNGAVAPPYEPEEVLAYEVGLKGEWFDRRLQANMAAFYYDASDLQVSVIVNTAVLTKNAAKAEAKGFEFELNAIPAPGWKIDFALGYLDSTYTEFVTADPQRPELGEQDLSGNYLPQAPEWTIHLGLQDEISLAHGGSLTLRVEGNHTSNMYFTPFNVAVNEREANTKANAFVTYRSADEHWSVQAYGRNLTDEKVIAYNTPTSGFSGYPVVGYFEPPRTYGLVFGYNF